MEETKQSAEAQISNLTAKLNCEKSKFKTLEEGCLLNDPNLLKRRTSSKVEEVIRVIDSTAAQFDPIYYFKEIAKFSGKINSSLSFEEWIGRFDNVASCTGWSDEKNLEFCRQN